MLLTFRNVLLLSACYTTTSFTTATSTARITALHNSYLDSIGGDNNSGGGERTNTNADVDLPQQRVEEPPSIDLDGQIVDRQSNLAFRGSGSVNEDPRPFDAESRLVYAFVLLLTCLHEYYGCFLCTVNW